MLKQIEAVPAGTITYIPRDRRERAELSNTAVKVGDVVGRKSYRHDVFFRVKDIQKNDGGSVAILKGLDVRLLADAPVDDLEIKPPEEIMRYRHGSIVKAAECMRRIRLRRTEEQEACGCASTSRSPAHSGSAEGEDDEEAHYHVTGRVLHLDGDEEYLQKCLQTYAQLEVSAYGVPVPETEQAQRLPGLLHQYHPDILVLTGHDALLRKGSADRSRLDSYRSSRYFVDAVQAARSVCPGLDELVVFAGACQSHYEAILEAGANFASSPGRVLIHAYDPVFLVEKLAYTSIYAKLSAQEVIANTITGMEGIGGVDTRGRMRRAYPGRKVLSARTIQ